MLKLNKRKKTYLFPNEATVKKVLEKFKMHDCNPISILVECEVKLSKYDKGEGIDPAFFKSLV